MRVPRVDYSIAYGIPNACTTPCHKKKSLAWANDAVVKWYGPTRTRGNDYVAALSAARKGRPDAERLLRAAVLDTEFPPIARATALDALGRPAQPGVDGRALRRPRGRGRPGARLGGARCSNRRPPPTAGAWARPCSTDPVRLVRASAAAVSLADTPPSMLSADESQTARTGDAGGDRARNGRGRATRGARQPVEPVRAPGPREGGRGRTPRSRCASTRAASPRS